MRLIEALMDANLLRKDLQSLKQKPFDVMKSINEISNKTTSEGVPKIFEEESNELIIIPFIALSTRNVGVGNDTICVTTIVYEVKCKLDHGSLLKNQFSRASNSDNTPPSNLYIHFIPYDSIQVIGKHIVKK